MKRQMCTIIILAICLNWLLARNTENIFFPTQSKSERLNFTQLASESGYVSEEYDVITEDGYVLKLFHIPGDKRKPVLLSHGILDSADTFLLRGRQSLAAALIAEGYDLWFSTSRGTRYARQHLTLNADHDLQFWNYSMHEMGQYDLPATIDFILDKTAQKQLKAIAHSQGNTLFYIMGSIRPEYNNKVKGLLALGPVCFLNHVNNGLQMLVRLRELLSDLLSLLNKEEVLGDDSLEGKLLRMICSRKGSYFVCGKLLFLLGGADPEEFEPEFYSKAIEYYPTGTSRKNLLHISQVAARKRFSQFDYGTKNLHIYNTVEPPNYDLSKVTMNVSLFVGRNDYVSTLADVNLLYKMLPNAEYRELEREQANHLDLVWGRTMNQYLSPYILESLK